MGPVTDLPMRWRFWIPVWVLALLVVAFSVWMIQPVAAAAEPVDACVPFGTAEGQILYFCENEFSGMDCVWDPSPVLGAGVMDCD